MRVAQHKVELPNVGHRLGVTIRGLVCAFLVGPVHGEDSASSAVHTVDFTEQPAGEAVTWLQNRGYELRLDAKALNPRFNENGLTLSTDGEEAGLFVRKMDVGGASRLRVDWGVERYPEGADWEGGVYRVPIAVMVSFGEEGIESGSFFVPDAPYFISVFLSENAQPGKVYTANYYQKGGRYLCRPCNPPPGKTVSTEIDLDETFRMVFVRSEVPPITSFSFQMNTEDTSGGARAYIKRIQFLTQ
ncbi:DUF3047 domain-containing protein [Nitrosococcus halophilus]|nr:DUF3047 domain-containing protein [Nitrosococcus halophilus]